MLPVAIWMLFDTIDHINSEKYMSKWSKLPWFKICFTAGVITGMILFEFRMIFVIVTYVIALLIARLIKHKRQYFRLWIQELIAISLTGVISIVLFLPWAVGLNRGKLITYATISANSIKDLVLKDYQTWLNIRFYIPIGLLTLALVGLVWAIIKKDWLTASLGLWVGFMASLYALLLIHIPWVQYVQSFAVIISLYIPVGIFAGYIGGDIARWLSTRKPGKVVLYSCIVILGLMGLWNQRDISHPDEYAFITTPDMQAMQWIKENISPGAFFLVEGMHENWITNIIGTDAGWWMPLLANRQDTIPPQYALANEQPVEKDYTQHLAELQSALEKTSIGSKEAIKQLCDFGITNIYIGQKQGTVGDQAQPLYTPGDLAENSLIRLIYHRDKVYIYSLENACGQ